MVGSIGTERSYLVKYLATNSYVPFLPVFLNKFLDYYSETSYKNILQANNYQQVDTTCSVRGRPKKLCMKKSKKANLLIFNSIIRIDGSTRQDRNISQHFNFWSHFKNCRRTDKNTTKTRGAPSLAASSGTKSYASKLWIC